MMYLTTSSKSGFTLIELLVSMTIFSAVMTMAAGTLLVLLDANAKAQNKQQILNNLTTAVDSMSREIRTGYNYVCAGIQSVELPSEEADCPSGDDYLSFVEAGDSLTGGSGSNRIAFAFAPNWFGSGRGAIIRRVGDGDGDGDTNESEDWIPVTAANTTITSAEFVVTGTGDGEQPTVTIFIAGEAGELAEVEVDFELQTSITQRPLDI
jgi:prepilin-type N-terminal cleavage/methylation domain-containing protein